MTTWTPEQLHIFSRVSDTSDNLLIEALAGSGKTTTLVEVARRLGGGTLALAFNKRAADEMSERLGANVEARTLNSLGHRILAQKLGKRLRVSSGKMAAYLREAIDAADTRDRDELWEAYGAMIATCRWAKAHGHVPDAIAEATKLFTSPLLSDNDVADQCPEELTSSQYSIVLSALRRSWSDALDGLIDFDDQLLLPTFLRCLYPVYHNVLVDEAQDLSALNHLMLRRLAKRRFIGVGDSLQAIYAFRGAHEASMTELRSTFSAETLHLSTSFRCPEAVCSHVRHHAQRINAWAGNPTEGSVTYARTWNLHDVPNGSAILCRNNAPLFGIAIELLRRGRRPNIWGRDLASGLIKMMERLGGPSMTQANALATLEAFATREAAKLKKVSAKRMLADRVSCIHTFLQATENLGQALALAREIFESKGVIDLATGHKAKGSEWPDVFILDHHLIGDGAQEANLAYVMATRAMRNLTYVNSDTLEEVSAAA